MAVRSDVIQGDALECLKKLQDASIDCCVTSPPYWGLRAYGTNPRVWDGDPACEHEWSLKAAPRRSRSENDIKDPDSKEATKAASAFNAPVTEFCSKCGAWRGELGLEPNFDLYIQHLCQIFDEVRRVLKPTGTCWVVIGDTYASSNKGTGGEGADYKQRTVRGSHFGKLKVDAQLEDKCLSLVPMRFALKMIDRGWILRNVIIWKKENAMPSSVKDRFTVDFEYVLFFVKNRTYYFEQQFEPYTEALNRWGGPKFAKGAPSKFDGVIQNYDRGGKDVRPNPQGRNKRCVWSINTQPLKEKHYAAYPESLIEPMIKAGCPEMICSKCHRIREKVYQKKEYIGPEKGVTGKYVNSGVHSPGAREHYLSEQRKFTPDQKVVARFIKSHIKDKHHIELLDNEFGRTTWEHWIRTDNSGASLPSPEDYRKLKRILELPSDYDEPMLTTVKVLVDDEGGKEEFVGYSDCGCGAPFEAGTVLDPFCGSGTTGIVAKKLHRNFIGIELVPKYVEMSRRRIEKVKAPVEGWF